MPKRCVASAAGCSNERSLDEGIYLYILPFYGDDRPEAKKRRKKWMDFVRVKRAKWQPSQSSVLCSEHFKREDFVRSADLGDEKNHHFKEMAKYLCLSFTSVNRLVLRGSEKKNRIPSDSQKSTQVWESWREIACRSPFYVTALLAPGPW